MRNSYLRCAILAKTYLVVNTFVRTSKRFRIKLVVLSVNQQMLSSPEEMFTLASWEYYLRLTARPAGRLPGEGLALISESALGDRCHRTPSGTLCRKPKASRTAQASRKFPTTLSVRNRIVVNIASAPFINKIAEKSGSLYTTRPSFEQTKTY